MIAATYTQGRGYCAEDVPVPRIGDDELLVRVMASSICGTDLRMIRNGHRKLSPGQKIVLGHEFTGMVTQVGPRTGAFQVGQRIGVAPNMGCGQCDACVRGIPNLCPDYTAFGITMDGGHTEYVRIPAATIAQGGVAPLPERLPFIEASLIEPLSCVVSGSRAARIELGDTVLVIGAGPIGLMHLMIAQISGAARVIAADVQAHRLAKAAEIGASDTVNTSETGLEDWLRSETGGRGADVVITACSVPAVQEQALGLVAPFGRVCFFGGLPKDGSNVRLDTNLIHYKQLVVTGTTGGSPRDFRIAMHLIASGRVKIRQVVSHVFPLSEIGKAFDTAMNQETMKVVLESCDY